MGTHSGATRSPRAAITLAVVLLSVGAAAGADAGGAPQSLEGTENSAPSVTGYGPWEFGMSLEEVTAVEEYAPYEPVRASMGGVETSSGPLADGVKSISFVFNSADELYDIRVWYDIGDSYEEAVGALHRAYMHLEERFGPVRAGSGFRLDEGMSLEDFAALMPEGHEPSGDEVSFDDYIKGGGEEGVNTNPLQLRLGPAASLHEAVVFVSYATIRPTTMRIVTLYYRGTEFLE